MKAIWSLFWQLLALRRGPADMPRSVPLLLSLILLNIVLSVLGQWVGNPQGWRIGLGMAGIGLAIDVVTLWALLQFKSQPGRYVQTLTAVYAADTMLSLCALPLLPIYLLAPAKSALLTIGFMIDMLITGWSLGVRGFIYHRSLNVGIFQGNMLSITLFLLTMLASVKLFPELIAKAAI